MNEKLYIYNEYIELHVVFVFITFFFFYLPQAINDYILFILLVSIVMSTFVNTYIIYEYWRKLQHCYVKDYLFSCSVISTRVRAFLLTPSFIIKREEYYLITYVFYRVKISEIKNEIFLISPAVWIVCLIYLNPFLWSSMVPPC